MKKRIFLPLILLTGCMAANPTRPVLTCAGECTYYGPQQPDPRVEMAKVLTGGLSSVVGIVVGGDVLKSLGSASSATSTIERTTNNNTTSITDRANSISDRQASAVSDVRYTSISDTAITDTTVSDTTISDTSSVSDTAFVGPAQ
ncbi:MAG: hypothetical protein VBE63_15330 [Lamprobacter sp.]|uniref:hypothetical protein n=1 Tax=Lamprobacter sp. TaxID=3100796 RepID=UPI002B2605E8|nr:hypothetical protein [Lamprobacter sp.]MEA3641296.1 hypothetical protein [Lamprobacter sp.]